MPGTFLGQTQDRPGPCLGGDGILARVAGSWQSAGKSVQSMTCGKCYGGVWGQQQGSGEGQKKPKLHCGENSCLLRARGTAAALGQVSAKSNKMVFCIFTWEQKG